MCQAINSDMTGLQLCGWPWFRLQRVRGGLGALPVRAALSAAVLVAVTGCAGQESPLPEPDSGTVEQSGIPDPVTTTSAEQSGVPDPVTTTTVEQSGVPDPVTTTGADDPEMSQGTDASAGGAAVFAFSCGNGAEVGRGLPQGHPGLDLDVEALGMVEQFVFWYFPANFQVASQGVQLVPESLLGDWSSWPAVDDHVLEFLDGSGEVVHTEALGVTLTIADTRQDWSAVVVRRPAYRSLRIRRGDQIAAEFASSPGAPVLESLNTHVPDPRFPVTYGVPARVRFSWVACDPDADPLLQSTYYSSDGGHGYRLIEQTITEPRPQDPNTTTTAAPVSDNGVADYSAPSAADTSAPLEYGHLEKVWNLERSPEAHVMVVVSDGVRWSAAKSPRFELVHPTIWPVIWSPDDSAAYNHSEEIVLSAAADGAVGGQWRVLPSHMLRWHSDLDGEIHINEAQPSDAPATVGRIPSGWLTPGTHRITLTATDETDNSGSVTVTIEVLDE